MKNLMMMVYPCIFIKFESLGYCSNFEDFKIAAFVKENIDVTNADLGIKIVTFDNSEIKKLIQYLENEIDKQILEYKEPQLEKGMSKFVEVK